MVKDIEKKRATDKRKISFARHEFFSGPLPHPEIFQKYEAVCKGSAIRILKMAENQSRHRQNIENKIINTETRNETIGMFFSFFITISLMLIGAYLLLKDKETVGYLFIFSPALFHAGVYIYNKTQSKEQNGKKGGRS